MIYSPGATSQSIDIEVADDSGLPVTGLVAATMPSIYWSLAGNTQSTQITLSDLTLITSAYSNGGVKERAGGSGVYRLDVPNAALTTAGAVKIRGDATGKHVICEVVTVMASPPTVVQVRQEMDSNSTKLANLGSIASIVGRLTFNGSNYLLADVRSFNDDPQVVTRLSGYMASFSNGGLFTDMTAAILDGPASVHNIALSVGAKINASAASTGSTIEFRDEEVTIR